MEEINDWQPAIIRPPDQWCIRRREACAYPDVAQKSAGMKIRVRGVVRGDMEHADCGCKYVLFNTDDALKAGDAEAKFAQRTWIAMCQILTD